MFNPEVQKRKTVVMQRIQQAASRGYIHYTQGVVHRSRVARFAEKINDKYFVSLNENQRSYRRKKGLANAFLYLYPVKGADDFYYWLLATDGDGEIHQQESLSKIYDKHNRLTWGDDYELAYLPREGKKPVITWRMTRSNYENWNNRIRKAIRQRFTTDAIRQSIWSLSRSPGFSEIRIQVKRLQRLIQEEWSRTRSSAEPMPSIPPIGYVRGLKSDSIPLSDVLVRLQKGRRPFPRSDAKKTT